MLQQKPFDLQSLNYLTNIWPFKEKIIINSWNRESRNKPKTYIAKWFLIKVKSQLNGEMTVFSTNGARKIGHPFAHTPSKDQLNLDYTSHFKLTQDWSQTQKYSRILKLLEENTRDFEWGIVLKHTIQAKFIKEHVDKLYFIKINNFGFVKILLTEWKDKSQTGKKYFQITFLTKNLYPEYIKRLLKLNNIFFHETTFFKIEQRN